MSDGNSPAQQARDEGDYLQRRSRRRVRTEKAGAVLPPGDALVELEGGRSCRCRRVYDRGLVKGVSGWLTARN